MDHVLQVLKFVLFEELGVDFKMITIPLLALDVLFVKATILPI